MTHYLGPAVSATHKSPGSVQKTIAVLENQDIYLETRQRYPGNREALDVAKRVDVAVVVVAKQGPIRSFMLSTKKYQK